MFDIELKGLDELIRKLNELPEKLLQEIEMELRKAAQTLCERAKSMCTDPLIRSQINYRVFRTEDNIGIEIIAPNEAKDYLNKAFEEISPYLNDYVRQALDKALKTLAQHM